MTTVALVSGGLDSYLASKKLQDPLFVFVDYGQPYAHLERKAVADLYEHVHYVDIKGLPWNHFDTYIPARNLMLATLALRFGTQICIAGVKDEICQDKNPAAFQEMSIILNKQAKGNVCVFSPMWSMTKAEAVLDYLDSGGDPHILTKTISCYGSGDSSCLNCQSCFRRWAALCSNGIEVEKPHDDIILTYGIQNLGNFPKSRSESIFKALGNVVTIDLKTAVDDPTVVPADKIVVLTSRLPEIKGTEDILKDNNIHFNALFWNYK